MRLTQSTGEASTDRLNLPPGESTPFVSSLRQMLHTFLEDHWPSAEKEAAKAAAKGGAAGAGGTPTSHSPARPTNHTGDGGEALRSALSARISALELPDNFLDVLIDELGFS